MSAPEIGVLVPVRLETRFVPPTARNRPWLLRVRVVPDAVSITNHDDRPSAVELDAVEAMWVATGGRNLESVAGRRAWRALAAATGAERAAWLARTFPPVTGPDGQITIQRPDETRSAMRAPRLMGLPPAMEIWMARGGTDAVPVATLPVLADEIDLDLDDPDRNDQPWWASFAEAQRVGLAAEIDLGPGVPNDIDALYVVGIGGGDPGPLLTAQADSGRLGLLAPGAATSSVDGEPAVATGDTDTWRRLVPVGPRAQPGTVAAATALTGRAGLRGVVGGDDDHAPLDRAFVRALWPALWGHSLANVWGYSTDADQLGLWAAENLVPQGPLPSMRIGDQPYGILPATSLRRWQADDDDPAIEARLVPLVRTLVNTWAAAAERQAAQQQRDSLRDLVRNATATRYAWRWMLPTTLAHAVSFRFGQATPATELATWWSGRAAETPRLDPAARPSRQLVSVGWEHPVELPLAQPADLPAGTDIGTGLARLAAAPVSSLLAAGPAEGGRPTPEWGTSLLTELARHSLVATAANVARSAAGQPRSLVEPISRDRRSLSETEAWALRLQPTDLVRRGDPTVAVRRNVLEGLETLATAPAADLDRGLRAALDTATNRLDPWATGIAWRRLQALADAPRTLGVYGWVDSPRPRTSEPDHRFLLAPSAEQATVAAILRDRALHDPDADRWQLDLTSDAIRSALRLASETREGSHPSESLGRMVEGIVSRPDVIDRLRVAFPTIRFFAGPALLVRRVCDGAAVLETAVERPADLSQLGVRPGPLAALVELATAVDALADLHVAEATLGLVRGRPAAVSAATMAAAGQAPPPSFEVVRTPRSGRVVNTVALVVLPDATAPSGARPSPAALADPAVAAYLDERAGAPAGPAWTWQALDADGGPAGTVTLAAIGLRPCDTVGLGVGNLRDALCDVSGAAALGPTDPSGHATVRSLAAALIGLPAAREDVGAPPDATDAAVTDLERRYTAVRNAAIAAVADARAALEPTATAARRRATLGRLARWGITPLRADVPDPNLGDLVDRVRRAADALEQRVADAPVTTEGATAAALASAISALVAPEGPWPVFARLPASTFVGLRAEPAAAGSSPRLDPDWLETVTPVRPALARLEAAQLGQRLATGGRPLRAWTNRPGDPWQTVAPPSSDIEVVRPSRLVAVFGPPAVLPGRPAATTPGRVAVAVIDRFAETVPDAEQVSAVAFPHDLPTARAPQAILLAVPPVVDEELTPAALIAIVEEVRALARARMADVAEMGAAAGALHLAAIPAAGRAGVELGVPLMPYRFDLHLRLEAVHTQYDLRAVSDALRAKVNDPVWFLGRQWQLGEHRGRDAASPALVHLTVTETPVTGPTPAADDDPRITPPETIIESEPEQWWTIGRRVRVGRALRAAVPADRRRDPVLLLDGLGAPYDQLNGKVLDGLAVHRARASLGLGPALFAAEGVPVVEPPDDWQPAELAYTASFAAGPVTLTIPRHDGGDVDWYSATAKGPNPPAPTPAVVRTSYPTRVAYDGAPNPRWWQIEDHRHDPGAVAPHRTQLAALMLIHVTASHGDDWFTAPLVSPTGTLVAVTGMQVEDAMGLTTTCRPADGWSMFHVSGRRPGELLLWPTVANPLTAAVPLDEVLLGVDEDANVLWAIEQRVDGIELVEPPVPAPDAPGPAGELTLAEAPAGQVVATAVRRYRYLPSTTVPHLWHPYLLSDAGNVRRFVQGRLADLTVRPVAPRPGPTSRLLRNPAAGPSDPVHHLAPAAVPRAGLHLDRRYVLGRRTDGQPVLWVQRRRTPLSAAPASSLRFDVLEEQPEISP